MFFYFLYQLYFIYFALFISLSHVFSLFRLIEQFHKIISTNNYSNAYQLNLIIYKSYFSCDFTLFIFFSFLFRLFFSLFINFYSQYSFANKYVFDLTNLLWKAY